MSNPDPKYYALRFRSSDRLHKKGDIIYVTENVLYIGQTDECGLRITSHPDYADCCYAVLVKSENEPGWKILRQEATADITVNGMPLALAGRLHHGDLLKFDHTVVQFTEEQGNLPNVSYIQHRSSWGMWMVLATMFLAILGIVYILHESSKRPTKVFKKEIASICKIEADTLLVLSPDNRILDELDLDHPSFGTGFITDEGYFVTARHCVEFWLALEQELCPDFRDIKSPVVIEAIKAENDTGRRLVAKVKVTSQDGKQTWYFSSDDFTMDKSRDDIYECGGFDTPYLWRSVVSWFEKKDAELGDVAVMKWPDGKGNIHLGDPDIQLEEGAKLHGLGFSQDQNQQAKFSYSAGNVLQKPASSQDCFLCDNSFYPGFSGAPVFDRGTENTVAGIVTRFDGDRVLILPVSQIRHLINQIQEQ